MNDNKRRAIVWDTIERLAFRPSSDSDRDAWLGVYARTLHALWGMDRMWARFSPDDEFIVTFLNLKCGYLIESVEKYEASLVNDPINGHLYWKNYIDPIFLSKASLHTTVGKYPQQQMDELHRDVDAVLNGMIFHPRCHTHLEDLGIKHVQLDQEKGGLKSHEIRIGGGIENPYVFLFHLRYQFCLVHKDVRRDERLRLRDLFEGSIRRGERSVNPRKLFNFSG